MTNLTFAFWWPLIKFFILFPLVFVILYILLVSLLFALYLLIRLSIARISYSIYSRRNGHLPPKFYPHKDPIFGLDNFFIKMRSYQNNDIHAINHTRFQRLGSTYALLRFGYPFIATCDPDNMHAVFVWKNAEGKSDWGSRDLRGDALRPFCGDGFITLDEGPQWARSRAMVGLGLERGRMRDLRGLEEKVAGLVGVIEGVGEGKGFDMADLLHRLFFDLNADFWFGAKLGCLEGKPPPHAEGFIDSFWDCFRGGGMRISLGPLRKLISWRWWYAAIARNNAFIDFYVDKAMIYRSRYLCKHPDHAYNPDPKPSSLDNDGNRLPVAYLIATQTPSRLYLRHQVIQGFVGTQDQTSVLLENTLYHLARHPAIYARARAEVLASGPVPPTFDSLGKFTYLQQILYESIRLHTIVPLIYRISLRATTLPRGGGHDGKSPLYVPKGTWVELATGELHRSAAIYGSDPECFRPERWDHGFKPGPGEFVAFGAGPRGCPGQAMAVANATYVLWRLVREFERWEARDEGEWVGKMGLTCRNVGGCWVAAWKEDRSGDGMPEELRS